MKELFKKIIASILAAEARAVLARYHPSIVAVTGNVGKTSTKEAIFTVLSASRFARKSEKNFNNELGVPLTVLGLETGWGDPFKWISNIISGLLLIATSDRYPEWLVLEVGADRPGDIKAIARWLRPDIAVITGVPDVPVHVEYFSSAEQLANEKKELAKAIKRGGTIVLNGDDARVGAMRAEFPASSITYGFEPQNDVIASHMEIMYGEDGRPIGTRFRVDYGGSSVPLTVLGGAGKTHVYPMLAACAVGLSLGDDLVAIGSALASHTLVAGRMRLLAGANGSTIIDDTYNSSPAATLAALDALAEMHTSGRKIALLADMLELGKHSVEAHRRVGTRASEAADMLITVGTRARGIAQAAFEAGLPEAAVLQYGMGASAEAGKELRDSLMPGDIVLVKGSQSMRMERAVRAILADPAQAGELLVRQDSAWLRR